MAKTTRNKTPKDDTAGPEEACLVIRRHGDDYAFVGYFATRLTAEIYMAEYFPNAGGSVVAVSLRQAYVAPDLISCARDLVNNEENLIMARSGTTERFRVALNTIQSMFRWKHRLGPDADPPSNEEFIPENLSRGIGNRIIRSTFHDQLDKVLDNFFPNQAGHFTGPRMKEAVERARRRRKV